jgi:hypothetical protein
VAARNVGVIGEMSDRLERDPEMKQRMERAKELKAMMENL